MRIEALGNDVHVEQGGAGDPVLFLHGNPDSAALWHRVVARLGDRVRWIAIDLPDFGRSRAAADFDPTFAGLGRFVDAVVEALGVDGPLGVVAHDYGGAFAMAWAALHPEKARRLVAINHPFFVGDYRWHRWARIWRTPLLGELSTVPMGWWPIFSRSLRSGARALPEEHVREAFAAFTPATRRMILRLYRAADPAAFRRWEPRMRAATARIPTLVLWGEHDPYIPGWVAERFPDAGHWLPVEQPERVAASLLRFFAETAPASGRGN